MQDPMEIFSIRPPAEAAAQDWDRVALEARHGRMWDVREVALQFVLVGLETPFVSVIRKSDGVKGWLEFKPNTQFFFNFVPV